MKNYQTQGVILRRKNFFETDRMLWIYTKDYGSVKIIAKGARKTLAKLGGHLELFYLNEFEIAKGKNLDILTGTTIIDDFSHLAKNQKVLYSAYYIAELVCATSAEGQSNLSVFDLLIKSFALMKKDNFQKLTYFFELKLYNLIGLGPQIDKCIVCAKELVGNKFYFDYGKGGVLCEDCGREMYGDITLNANELKLLRLIKSKDIKYLIKIKCDQENLQVLKQCIDKIRHTTIEKELNCEKFI